MSINRLLAYILCVQSGRSFGLKSGGTKLEAPKAPRIETLKASRGLGMKRWTPPLGLCSRVGGLGERCELLQRDQGPFRVF